MGNPTAYEIVAAENQTLKEEVAHAKQDVAKWRRWWIDCKVELRECQDEIEELKEKLEQGVVDRDKTRTEAYAWKAFSGQADRFVESLKTKLRQALFERDEARAERADLEAKLDRLRTKARNTTKYSEEKVVRLSMAYETFMEHIHEAWRASPDLAEILDGDGSNDGDSE